jgi:hypothetical protein
VKQLACYLCVFVKGIHRHTLIMSAIQPEAALVGASTNGTQVPDDVEDLVRSDDPEHVGPLPVIAKQNVTD